MLKRWSTFVVMVVMLLSTVAMATSIQIGTGWLQSGDGRDIVVLVSEDLQTVSFKTGTLELYDSDGNLLTSKSVSILGQSLLRYEFKTAEYYRVYNFSLVINTRKKISLPIEFTVTFVPKPKLSVAKKGDQIVLSWNTSPAISSVMPEYHLFFGSADGSQELVLSKNSIALDLVGAKYEAAVCVVYKGLDHLAVSGSVFSEVLSFNPIEVQETNTETTEILCNYPNPFNPTTTISYNVASQAQVKLVVYNMLGQEVATLVDGVKSAGSYSASFDASAFNSGTYIYRLFVGDQVFTRRMLLLK